MFMFRFIQAIRVTENRFCTEWVFMCEAIDRERERENILADKLGTMADLIVEEAL